MADDFYAEFRKLSPKVTGGLIRMREESFRDGAVPGKYKVLAALAVVTVMKCEPCIKAYSKLAHGAGVTEIELIEFLNVAMTEGGCPAEQWAMKALKALRELKEGKDFDEEVCCRMDEL